MVTLLTMLALMQGAAGDYWDARGVPAPCPATKLTLMDGLDGRAGQAQLGGCAIELNRDWVTWRYQTVRGKRYPRRWKREDALQVCVIIAHEEGHARGLEHTDTGVMSWDATRAGHGMFAERPEECLRVIRPLIRTRRAAPSTGGSRTGGR